MKNRIRNILQDISVGITIITGAIYFFPTLSSFITALLSLIYISPKFNFFNTLIIIVLSIIIFIISAIYFERKRKKSLLVISEFIIKFATIPQPTKIEQCLKTILDYCFDLKNTLIKINKKKKYDISVYSISLKDKNPKLLKIATTHHRENNSKGQFDDSAVEEHFFKNIFDDKIEITKIKTKSYIFIPITDNNKLEGLLLIEGFKKNYFDKYDINILKVNAKILLPQFKHIFELLKKEKSCREQTNWQESG